MNNHLRTILACLTALAAACPLSGRAQTANWINSPGGEWNTATNWDSGLVPGGGTNATISGGYAVTYDLPMTALNFAGLSLGGALDLNTNGFNVDLGGASMAPLTVASGGLLNVNANAVLTALNCGSLTIGSGGTLNVSGSAVVIPVTAAATNSPLALTGLLNINSGGVLAFGPGTATTFGAGGTLTSSGTLIFTNCGAITAPNAATPINALTFNTGSLFTMTNTTGATGLNIGATHASQGAILTLNGGTVTLDKMLSVAGGGSRVFVKGGTLNCLGGSRVNDSSNDTGQRIEVSGGVANLGNFLVTRTASGGGLVVANGVVNATALQIGTGNSSAYATINSGGLVTNTGTFTVSDTTNAATASGDRRARFLIRGGTVVSTGAAGIVVGNQANSAAAAAARIGGILDINAGTLIAERITLVKDNTLTNAYGTLSLSGTGIIYLGTGGLIGNPGAGGSGYFINLTNGTLAAKEDWASSANMTLSGAVTFQAADAAATLHNISLSGSLSGSGAGLTKTGGGTLTLAATNTYSGATTINAGTLALAATGAIAASPTITLAAGAVYDISAGGGTNLLATQTLAGKGAIAGNLNVLYGASGAHLQPGGNTTAGTLTFSNHLSEAGNVINNFDLSDDPTGTVKTNDFLHVLGNLTFSGTNTIQVNPLNGPLPADSAYKLIQYGGSLSGELQTNLIVGGVSGILSNNAPSKTIWLVVPNATRGPASVVWLGSALSSTWDTQASANWLNVATAARDFFVTGDSVRFEDTGATNPMVALAGSVSPSATVVDTASNYTFTGSGTLDGTGSLTKTNAGTLSLLTLNNGYSGGTVVGAGVLEVAKLANGGLTSGLGASASDPTNLVFFGTTLRYLGGNVTSDRGATLNEAGVTVEVTNPATTLTLGGTWTGSGTLVKTGPGTLTLAGVNANAGGTVISNGALRLNNPYGASGGLTNQGATLRIGTTTTITNAVTFEGACTLDLLNNTGGNQALDGAWAGSGTVTVINQEPNSRTFTMGGKGSMHAFTGTLALGTNAGIFRLNDGGSTGSGPNFGSAQATFDVGTGSATLLQRNGGTVSYFGALLGGPNTKLGGNTVNAGNVTYVIGGKGADTAFQGTIADGISPTFLVKEGVGTLTLSASNTFTGGTTISNGVLALTGSGSLLTTPTITVMTNTVLDVSTRTDGTLTLRTGQGLLGDGTVRGSVNVPSGASLSPGPSAGAIGLLAITNTLVLQSGSILNLDLDWYQYLGGATHDQIAGLASVTYGGTLNLNVNSLETNSVFKLFSAGTYSGSFAVINPPAPSLSPGTWVWDTSRLAVDGTLRVALLRPLVNTLEWTGTDVILRGTNGTPYSTYHVLSSTNISLPVSLWLPIATNLFEYDGTFNATNAIAPGVRQAFYLIQVP